MSSALSRTANFLSSQEATDRKEFVIPDLPVTSSSLSTTTYGRAAADTKLSDLLMRKTAVAGPPHLLAVQPTATSNDLKTTPDDIPPYPDLRPFLSVEEKDQLEATHMSLDALSSAVGTFAQQLPAEAVVTLLGAWGALRDVLGQALHRRVDGELTALSSTGASAAGSAGVPLALLTKVWLAFLTAARSRAPGFDIAEDLLPVRRLDFAASSAPSAPAPPVVEAIRAARAAASGAAQDLPAREAVQLRNELAGERKLREAAEARLREAERLVDAGALKLREMQRVYESTEAMRLVHDTVHDFNHLPIQLADALRRLAESEREQAAWRSRVDEAEARAASSEAEFERTYAALVREIAEHKGTRAKLEDVSLMYKNLQYVSGAAEKDNVANLDLVKEKVHEVDELRKQLFQLEADREAMAMRRSELTDKLSKLTEDNAALLKENGIMRTEVTILSRNLKERELELDEATTNLKALQSIVGELKTGNSSMLRAFENKIEKAERKNQLLTEKLAVLAEKFMRFKEEKVDPIGPAVEVMREAMMAKVEEIRLSFDKEVIGIYHGAHHLITTLQREHDALKKTHADFVSMHEDTVADLSARALGLEAEVAAHLGTIEEQRAALEKGAQELESAKKQLAEQTERANALDRKLFLANREIEEKKKEIAILQRAQKELETLMEEYRKLKAEKEGLEKELKVANNKIETFYQRTKALEDKVRKLNNTIDDLKEAVREKEQVIADLGEKNRVLQEYANDVMREVANEKRKAEDAVLEVRRLSLELEKKLNSPDTVLAQKYRELINKSLKVRTIDIPFSRPVSRSPGRRKAPPPNLSGTWQDLVHDRVLSFFDTFEPLVAEVDERGLYRLQLPPGSGNWQISARGLLIIRNVDKDFRGIIIPPLPGHLTEVKPRVTYSREADRPRLPLELPVHAYQPMEKEPPGMDTWIDRHMDRRRRLPLNTVQPEVEGSEAPSEGRESPRGGRAGTLPSEESLGALIRKPEARRPPPQQQPVPQLASSARATPLASVAAPAASAGFTQMQGWRATVPGPAQRAPSPPSAREPSSQGGASSTVPRLPPLDHSHRTVTVTAGASQSSSFAGETLQAAFSSTAPPAAVRRQPAASEPSEEISLAGFAAWPVEERSQQDNRKRFVAGFATSIDEYAHPIENEQRRTNSENAAGGAVMVRLQPGLEEDLALGSQSLKLKRRPHSSTLQAQRDYSPPKPRVEKPAPPPLYPGKGKKK